MSIFVDIDPASSATWSPTGDSVLACSITYVAPPSLLTPSTFVETMSQVTDFPLFDGSTLIPGFTCSLTRTNQFVTFELHGPMQFADVAPTPSGVVSSPPGSIPIGFRPTITVSTPCHARNATGQFVSGLEILPDGSVFLELDPLNPATTFSPTDNNIAFTSVSYIGN
jgi:hypothetical protein